MFKPTKYKCLFENCQREVIKFRSTDKCYCAEHRYVVLKQNKKKAVRIKQVYKPTGERAVFIEIWNERPHFSELSGKPLYPISHPQWVWQFLHVLNKGRFNSLRLYKRNILLGLPSEQNIQDRFEIFQKRKEELLKEIYGKD